MLVYLCVRECFIGHLHPPLEVLAGLVFLLLLVFLLSLWDPTQTEIYEALHEKL